MLSCATALLFSVAAVAQESSELVIGTASETFFREMLSSPDGQLLAGCKLAEAELAQPFVRAHYTCGTTAARIELRPPSFQGDVIAKTERFAILAGDPPPSPKLLQAVVARLREREGAFDWVSAHPVAVAPAIEVRADGADGGTASKDPASEPIPEEIMVEYRMAMQVLKDGDADKAYDMLYKLSERRPWGVLGLLVAALASRSPSEELVAELAAQADADPKNPLKQFIAGVAAHYHGHQSGTSPEDKRKYYRIGLKYLPAAVAAYPSEARGWIYLAVSYYRTGRQTEAEEAIEKAVEVAGKKDADAFYCRAEIWHLKDPAKAVADMERYMAIVDENKKVGTITSRSKEDKVQYMYDYMRRVARGEIANGGTELFDPVKEQPIEKFKAILPEVAAGTAGVAVLGFAAVVWFRRRRATAS